MSSIFTPIGLEARRRFLLRSTVSLIVLTASAPLLAQQTDSSGAAQGEVQTQPVPGSAPSAGAEASSAPQTGPVDAQNSTEEIVVLGVRGAQRAAVDLKRAAPQIVDSIVAEDIGKLPDATIADSLQRVPGIQIGRSAGEGSSVNIRGLGQVLTTLNGEEFLGGSSIDGAQPNFTDIPPSLFSGVDVFKSPTARQLEGGVSGTIDLKTRRPFDLTSGITATGSAQGDYGSRVKKINQLYSGLLGWRNDSFGVLVAGSYSKAKLANISINTGNSWLVSTDGLSGRDLRGDGDVGVSTGLASDPLLGVDTQFANKDYVYQPAVIAGTNRETERKRYGLNGSFQAKFSDALTLTGDIAYTRLEDHDRALSIQLNTGYAPQPLLDGSVVDENGVVTVANFRLPGFATNSLSRPAKSRAYNTNLELVFDNDGPFRGSIRWVHGDARRDTQTSEADAKPVQASLVQRGVDPACRVPAASAPASCFIRANPAGLPFVDVGIDYASKYPTLSFGTDVTDPANWTLLSTWGYGDHREAQTDAFRADGTYEIDGGFLKSIDAGVRYNTRDVRVEEYKYLAPVTVPGLGLLDGPGDLYFFKDPQIGHTGRPEIEGLSVLPLYPFSSLGDQVRNFDDFVFGGVPTAGIPGVDPKAMDNPLDFQNSLFPGNARYTDPTRTFRVKEKNSTAYGQVNFGSDVGVFGMPFAGNVGLRVVHTNRSVFSNTTNPNQFVGTAGFNGTFINLGTTETKNSFTRWLPSGNISFNLDENQKLRFAAAKVVGSLNLFDLGGGQVLYYGANNGRYPDQRDDLQVFLQGSSGNPNLDPYQATSYNASYEYYFGRGGLLSAAVFLFDVKSFPQGINEIQPIADQDGVVRAGGNISSVGNGKGGTIKGLELGYQQQFDFLPGFLSGFGANANYTLSDSSSSNVDLFGKTLPVPDNSKHQFNLIGFYQKGPIQARVAYNWRSKRFAGIQSVNGVADGDVLATFSKPVGYLDASASYDVTPNFTVFAQGTNLTSEGDEQYAQFKNLYYQQTLFERRLTLGIRIRN